VKGILREHTAVPAQAITVRTGTSGGADLTVAGGTSSTIAPGPYGNTVVRAGATLVLATSGLYRFKSLQFEPDTRLSVLGGSNPSVLAVEGNVSFGDRFKMDSGGGPRLQQSQVQIYSNGTAATVGFDAFLAGTLAAPSALVTLQDRSYFSGCVGGRNVTVGFDATVGSGGAGPDVRRQQSREQPGFESGTTGWTASAGAALSTTTSRFHSGTRSGSVTNRTTATQGAVSNLLSTAPQGATYDVSVWAEPSTSTSQPLTLTARVRCNGGTDQITQLAQTTGPEHRLDAAHRRLDRFELPARRAGHHGGGAAGRRRPVRGRRVSRPALPVIGYLEGGNDRAPTVRHQRINSDYGLLCTSAAQGG
jgi:hypothetical protein